MKLIQVLLLNGIFLSVLFSCGLMPSAHENFKNSMQSNIGKKVDSLASYIARYPQLVGSKTKLKNGNEEIEFLQGKFCRVFFEVDKTANTIINWRYEGSENDCQIVP